MRISVFIVLLVLLSTGCTKFGKTVTLKGRVLNPVTGEGIEGVKVRLQRPSGGIPGGNKTVKETTSGAGGSFELNKGGVASYSAICETGGLYDLGWTHDGGQTFTGNFTLRVKKGKVMNADYYAVPYGNLKLFTKNISCVSSEDKLELYFDGAEVDSRQFSIGLLTTLTGCIDINGEPTQMAGGKKYFHWVVTKNGITTTNYDTVNVVAGQTVTLNIFY